MALDRILIHHSDGRRIPVEPADIFYLEAEDHDTLIRLRSKRLLREARGLSQLEGGFAGTGFAGTEHLPDDSRGQSIFRIVAAP